MYLRQSRLESKTPIPYTSTESRYGLNSSNMLASSSSALDLPVPASVVPCATRESVRVMEPYAPPAWSVILVMKRLSWDRIIAGEKTLEIRFKPLKPKRYLVGREGEIWGTLVVGPVLVIQTDEEWRALLPSHCWHVDKRPYKKTYALTLGKIESFTASIGYATPRGQPGITKYRADAL